MTTCLALGGAATGAVPGPAAAQPAGPAARPAATTVTLYPAADAYVNEALPSTNYNSASAWPVARNASGQERYTLLQFDLSSIPADSQVDSAELRMWLDSATGPTLVTVWVEKVALAWDQATVTWNSRPPDQCCWAALDVGQPTSHDQVWDVRTLVNNWVRGNFVNHGLAVHGPASGEFERLFTATGSRRPRLVVRYVPPTPSATPSTTATATAMGTASPTRTATLTTTPSITPSATPTVTPTPTASPTATASPTHAATSTLTPTTTPTVTPGTPPPTTTSTATPTASAAATASPTTASTGSPSATAQPSATATAVSTPSPSASAGPSATATSATATVAPSPSAIFTATATSVAGATATADGAGRIEGRVWADADRDGGEGPGELGLPGVRLDLAGPGGARVAVTDGGGHFAFASLIGGDYRVDVAEASLPAGFTLVSGREPWTGYVGPGVVVQLRFGYAALAVVSRLYLPWTEAP